MPENTIEIELKDSHEVPDLVDIAKFNLKRHPFLGWGFIAFVVLLFACQTLQFMNDIGILK